MRSVKDIAAQLKPWRLTLLSAEQLLEQKEPLFARSLVGVYFLFSGEEIVYIGKSQDILNRVQQHISKDWGLSGYTYIECTRDELDSLEYRYIRKFKPKFNKAGIPVEVE